MASTYNGLRIEMQLRSRLQHAWATAVETVGTFLRQALKSSQGEGAWLKFFALMGSALARREHTPLVPGTPGAEAVLVSVDSVTALRSAYPNYFLDTKAFVEAYKLAVDRSA
jgi:hypothetical protein